MKNEEHPYNQDCNRCGTQLFKDGKEVGIWWKFQKRFNEDYYCTGCYMKFDKIFWPIRYKFFSHHTSIFKLKPVYNILYRGEVYEDGTRMDLHHLESKHHTAYFRLFDWHCIRAYKKWVNTF